MERKEFVVFLLCKNSWNRSSLSKNFYNLTKYNRGIFLDPHSDHVTAKFNFYFLWRYSKFLSRWNCLPSFSFIQKTCIQIEKEIKIVCHSGIIKLRESHRISIHISLHWSFTATVNYKDIVHTWPQWRG